MGSCWLVCCYFSNKLKTINPNKSILHGFKHNFYQHVLSKTWEFLSPKNQRPSLCLYFVHQDNCTEDVFSLDYITTLWAQSLTSLLPITCLVYITIAQVLQLLPMSLMMISDTRLAFSSRLGNLGIKYLLNVLLILSLKIVIFLDG